MMPSLIKIIKSGVAIRLSWCTFSKKNLLWDIYSGLESNLYLLSLRNTIEPLIVATLRSKAKRPLTAGGCYLGVYKKSSQNLPLNAFYAFIHCFAGS